MGWLQLGRSFGGQTVTSVQRQSVLATVQLNKVGANAEHIEHAALLSAGEQVSRLAIDADSPKEASPPAKYGLKYPRQPEHLDDTQIPLIPKEEVLSKRRPGLTVGIRDALDTSDLWIVVDNVVYDCSDFINDHPGGRQVILSFLGEDCSWQFWRFHSESLMHEYGRPLRIGRTSGVKNRFQEAPRYVGLRRLGCDDC